MAYIKGISYYLPEQTLTTEQLSKDFGDEGIEQLAKTAGVNIRHIAAPDETAGDMAVKAAEGKCYPITCCVFRKNFAGIS